MALALEQWLARLTMSFGDRVLAIDARVADRWGALGVPVPIPTVHGLLAATALVHDMTLVTRNLRDVATTGARVLDPTADQALGGGASRNSASRMLPPRSDDQATSDEGAGQSSEMAPMTSVATCGP